MAAHALTILADASVEQASRSVVDGQSDNGIDAVYFHEEDRILYVVQAKWHRDGNGSIDVGDTLKTLAGFRDLLDGSIDKFNQRLQLHRASIESAIGDASARFALTFVHTGKTKLSPV